MIKVNARLMWDEERLEGGMEVCDDQMQLAVSALCRQILRNLLRAADAEKIDKKELMNNLCCIWDYQEEGQYDRAYDVLFLILLLLDEDSRIILDTFVFSDESMKEWFMDYLCEYLLDGCMICAYEGGDCDEFEGDCNM
ncbi:MAG: hypothetical protein Q4B26_20310 [Eubacteriales bacterium]|nr:hypothetical protein [Eubacteriales bacterium]